MFYFKWVIIYFLSIGCHKSRQQTSGGPGIRHQVSASGIGESFPTPTT